MAVAGGLFNAKVFHKRLTPKINAFTYNVYYVCLPLSELAQAASRVFSLNRFNLLSFYDRDHGLRDGSPVEAWVRGVLQKFGVTAADGEIVMLAHPRILGHVFNPVTFWFCLDKERQLRAVLAEVNNTFKQRHSYLITHPDQRVILPHEVLSSAKCFHVSPFMHIEGEYRFRFVYGEQQVGVWLDYFIDGKPILNTSLVGRREALNGKTALIAFIRIPLVTLRTVALIHWQALKLWYKGIKYVPKPELPPEDITR